MLSGLSISYFLHLLSHCSIHNPSTTSLSRLLSRFAQRIARFWAYLVMIVERAAYSWAYSEDIPGSRCGPEDGPWPRSYQVLPETELWRELRILAKPQSTLLDARRGWKADSINFQPSPTTKTQDRYIVTQLDIHGRLWTLTGVFDGVYRGLNPFARAFPLTKYACRPPRRRNRGARSIPLAYHHS